MKKNLCFIGVLLVMAGCASIPPNIKCLTDSTCKVTLAWDEVPEVDGYKLYWGRKSGEYNYQADAGKKLTYTVNRLGNSTWCFVATSYVQDMESTYSNEACVKPEQLSDAGLRISSRKVDVLKKETKK